MCKMPLMDMLLIQQDFCEISPCAYSIDNICQECYEGFYLDSNKTCQQIPFQYCESGNAISCSRCNEAAKKNGSNCVLKDEIRGCSEYSEDGKTCLRCSEGFLLSEDKKTCNLKYCQQKSEYCIICEDGYFSNGTSCIPFFEPEKDDETSKSSESFESPESSESSKSSNSTESSKSTNSTESPESSKSTNSSMPSESSFINYNYVIILLFSVFYF